MAPRRSLLLPLLLLLLLAGCPVDPPVGDDDDDDSTPDIPLPDDGTTLAQAAVQIVGEAGRTERLGHAVLACDIDDDGRDDLLVAAPEAAGGVGYVAAFLGAGSSSWDDGLTVDDADVRFDGQVDFRLGYGIGCGDVDGDGLTDVVTTRARFLSPMAEGDFHVLVYHQSSELGWPERPRAEDAGGVRSTLGVGGGGMVTAWLNLAVGDLNGDGAAEIVLTDRRQDGPPNGVTDRVWVLPGRRYDSIDDLDATASTQLSGEGNGSLQGGVLLIDDFDGDGEGELLVGEPFSGPGSTHLGQIWLVDEPSGAGPLATTAYAGITEGGEARAFGADATLLDADGDGDQDLLISGIEENIEGPEPHGGLWLYIDASSLPASRPVNSGEGHVAGDPTAGFLGMQLEGVLDRDGDGADDVLVYQPDLMDEPGTLWLLSGAAITGSKHPEDVAVTTWKTERRGEVDDTLAVGDFDGDGVEDYVLGTPGFEGRTEGPFTNTGHVYVWLSGRDALPAPEPTDWLGLQLWFPDARSFGPVQEGAVVGPGGSTSWTGAQAAIQVDRRQPYDLRVAADGWVDTRLVGLMGDRDALLTQPLWGDVSWQIATEGAGAPVDPSKGHLAVGVFKRDGAGAIGVGVDIDAGHQGPFFAQGKGAFVNGGTIPAGPASGSYIFFVNVDPGEANVSFTLDSGESCYPAPGGSDESQIAPLPIEAGVLTVAQYRCWLNRF